MSHPETTVAAAVAVVLTASLAAQSSSQADRSQPDQTAQRPVFRTEANYIRVDAYVTRGDAQVTDLAAVDFELLEDGIPQTIDAFEFVRIRPAGPQASRVEPNSQQLGEQMAADPRARVFVLFLDVDHVPIEGSHRVQSQLARMLGRMLGPDDFIGMLTSRHGPSELILGRKTALIEEQLEKYWYWGQQDGIGTAPEEDAYVSCFMPYEGGEAVIREMIDRRREKLALDALHDLVIHLRGIREERKAVLALTAGWRLFRDNPSLARPLYLKGVPKGAQTPQMPGPPPIGVGPGGRPILGNDPRTRNAEALCERHRWELAHTDTWLAFQDLLRDANRANVSFYPIDPRGLAVFDSPLGPRLPLPLNEDRAALRTRQESIRWMAGETDGLAVLDRNDLEPGLRRIADDLSSYYLLGYYSSNPAFDGKYRTITVRVKRPGLRVRHRRGYRAATREEGEAAATTAEVAAAAAESDAVSRALGRLARIRPDASLYVHATIAHGGALWVEGEVGRAAARDAGWKEGGRVSLVALDASGNTVGMARRPLAAGVRAFAAEVPLEDASAEVARVMVRAEPAQGSAVGVEVAPARGEPLIFRKANAGAPEEAAADFRLHRTETVVVRWPASSGPGPGRARVLDRAGSAMPLQTSLEADPSGGWLTASMPLAPLAPGDYVLELTRTRGSDTDRTLVAFRVVR